MGAHLLAGLQLFSAETASLRIQRLHLCLQVANQFDEVTIFRWLFGLARARRRRSSLLLAISNSRTQGQQTYDCESSSQDVPVAVTLHDCLLESSESLPAAPWAR